MNFDDNECKVCKKKTSYNLLVQIQTQVPKIKNEQTRFSLIQNCIMYHMISNPRQSALNKINNLEYVFYLVENCWI